ncbi:MAG: serine/threonine protein kinase [Candidatus Obscuribacterales bacterium]|nr:serine/threonine protein kinase [Candidatus Obscuribacterales bacterium]
MLETDTILAIQQAEALLLEAENPASANHEELALRLEACAKILRAGGERLLDAANMEARARTLREQRLEAMQISFSQNPVDKHLGRKIGNYLISELLNSGAAGRIYRAFNEVVGKTVAVKILRQEAVDDPELIKRFVREAQSIASLSHPNIVSLLDFGITDDGYAYMIMDLVEGESLAQVLQSLGMLSSETAISIAMQIADAMGYAHEKGVIHRDLKPSNVMLTRNPADNKYRVKLVDFGIAARLESDENGATITHTGQLVGTPSYMSPEQCSGQRVDEKTDVYALGCLFFEMLTGQKAFPADNPMQAIVLHLKPDWERLSRLIKARQLSPYYMEFVSSLLEPDAQRRLSGMKAVKLDLNRLLHRRRPRASSKKAIADLKKMTSFAIAGLLICVGVYAFRALKVVGLTKPVRAVSQEETARWLNRPAPTNIEVAVSSKHMEQFGDFYLEDAPIRLTLWNEDLKLALGSYKNCGLKLAERSRLYISGNLDWHIEDAPSQANYPALEIDHLCQLNADGAPEKLKITYNGRRPIILESGALVNAIVYAPHAQLIVDGKESAHSGEFILEGVVQSEQNNHSGQGGFERQRAAGLEAIGARKVMDALDAAENAR